MATQKEIDEIVKMLDEHMSQGSGHINVKVNDPGHVEIEKIDIMSGAACDLEGDTACKIPTVILPDDDEF